MADSRSTLETIPVESERENSSLTDCWICRLLRRQAPAKHSQHRLKVRGRSNQRGHPLARRIVSPQPGQVRRWSRYSSTIRLDLGQFNHLMDQGFRGHRQRVHDRIGDKRLAYRWVVSRIFSVGTGVRWVLRCPGCSPRFLLLGEAGGLRFIPIGSDDGGFDELVELSLSRFSRSLTRASSLARRCS